jgi:gas vesicle protein
MKKTLISIGIGAGVMYLMDPEHGEERRTRLCNKLSAMLPKTREALHTKVDAISTKADSLAADAVTTVGSIIEHAPATEEK